MRDCLCISLFMLHISAGCNLSNDQKTIVVTGYTGGSVLLPCSCDDPKSTVNTFTWGTATVNQMMNVFEHEKYRGRLKLFNETSPANLSLLISDLRKEDKGIYGCYSGPRSFTDVFLTVKGCDLNRRTHTVEVTGYLGESVVLPCSCTEPLAKPDQIKWKFIEINEEIYPSEHSERYKNRRKLINQTTPGNLSLHLLSLTKEDQGDYQCYVSSNNYIYIRLHVEEKPQVHTIYSSTHQPSQQTHELKTTQQPEDTITHQPHQYVVILIAVFVSVLLLAILALLVIFIMRSGKRSEKLDSDWPVATLRGDIRVTSDAAELI
ncbi:polymeric immunoglobulin receptor-like [Misgurnus anguillicaudatus]|uniref:polymeric immunoglobulin receptor-like n=1 Tax=Misgurnus anguillicaudatus TaxID=75329 RepID=UPI003CCF5BF1